MGFGSSGSTGMERRRKPKSLGKEQAGRRSIYWYVGSPVSVYVSSSNQVGSRVWVGMVGGYASFLNEMVCKKGCESMGG